jgi:hypothetical protein
VTTVDQLKRYIADWKPAAHQGTPYIVSWQAALSNVDWTDRATGHGICYRDSHGDRCLVLCDVDQLHRSEARAEQCLYVVDDGESALPYNVSGWCFFPGQCAQYIRDGYVLLRRQHPRTAHGHGPRRSWHLLIKPITEGVS